MVKPVAKDMVMIGTVDFTGHGEMYFDVKAHFIDNKYENVIYDDEYKTVWVLWDKERKRC